MSSVCRISFILLLALVGCRRTDRRAAAEGAPALVRTAVGPPVGNMPAPVVKNPLEAGRVSAEEGRRLFIQYNCYGCHGGRAGGGMGPSLRDVVWLYGHRPDQIFASIADGRAHGMPAWGYRLGEGEVWQLTSYILSLRTEHEPDPPK